MARLTTEQWQQAKADYEIHGLKAIDIADKYQVSRGRLSQVIKQEQWEQDKTKQTKQNKANAIIELAKIETETKQQLNTFEQANLDLAVSDEIAFRTQNDADMQLVRDKAIQLLDSVDSAGGVKGIMDTLRIQREARLGKSPETAIQINNQADTPTKIVREIIDPKA